MPLLEHPVVRPLGLHRVAVQLAREPYREVADVDHLLDFALSLSDDLSHFQADQLTEFMLVFAELVADLANDLAAPGSGHLAPLQKRSVGPNRDLLVFLLGDLADVRDPRPVDGTGHLQLRPRGQPLPAEAAEVVLLDSKFGQKVLHEILYPSFR